jgi:hypothetical protein
MENTNYMLLTWHQDANQNCGIRIVSRSFDNMSQFKYLGMTVTNQRMRWAGHVA